MQAFDYKKVSCEGPLSGGENSFETFTDNAKLAG